MTRFSQLAIVASDYLFRHAQSADYDTIAGSCSAGADTSIS